MKNSQLLQQLAEALATIDSLRAQVKVQTLHINSLRHQKEVQMRNLEDLQLKANKFADKLGDLNGAIATLNSINNRSVN
jgi:chromosome segregation ATPase